MARNRIVWQGLEQLRADLRKLPDHLRDEGRAIVRATGEAVKAATIANYPEITGNLRRGVVSREEVSAHGIVVTVASRAFHAHLYEQGGAVNRAPAPPEKRLGTHAARERRKMHEQLKALIASQGLEVRET